MKSFKHTFLLTVLMSMVGVNIYAHEIEVENSDGVTIYYSYNINSDRAELSVSARNNNLNSYSGVVVIPNSVTYNGTTYIVTSIGYYAFQGCTNLTSVTIPNSVTSIGGYAFSGCTGLTSVTIPNSVTNIDYCAFQYCSSLTSVTIPNSVTNIDYSAFQGCSNLTSVIIPHSVTSIGSDAFKDTGIYKNAPQGIFYVDNWVCGHKGGYNTILSLQEGTRGIAASAFKDCSGLISITIPNSVSSIGRSAFEGCSNLSSVTIGSSVTSIDTYAFKGCSSLTSITIPNSVISIGGFAFSETGIYTNSSDGVFYVDNWVCGYKGTLPSNLTLPEGTRGIAGGGFYGCSSLATVTIPNSVLSIGYGAFEASYLTNITIPNSVTSIEDNAFRNCYKLKSVTIPNSVTIIGDYAFAGAGLTSVTIPNSVTSIGNYAFSSCSSLTSVTIPNSVTSIGVKAFSTGLTSIVVEDGNSYYDSRDNCNALIETSSNSLITGCKNTIIPNSVTSIGNYAFDGCI